MISRSYEGPGEASPGGCGAFPPGNKAHTRKRCRQSIAAGMTDKSKQLGKLGGMEKQYRMEKSCQNKVSFHMDMYISQFLESYRCGRVSDGHPLRTFSTLSYCCSGHQLVL
jgi:hypothetical protein